MLQLQKVSKSFGKRSALNDINLNVRRGDILGLIGPNGSGKTTLMRIASGFLRPDKGTVQIGAHDMVRERKKALALLGYLPEISSGYDDMDVVDFLKFCARARGVRGQEIKNVCDKAMERTQITDVGYLPIKVLSKGFKRRVGLAQAILMEPPLLLLDEPTDGLDPVQTRRFRLLIKELAKHCAVMMSTHQLDEVDAICTRTAMMRGGQLILDASPTELQQVGQLTRHVRILLHAGEAEGIANILIMDQAVSGLRAEWDDGGQIALVVAPYDDRDLKTYLHKLAHQYGWSYSKISYAGGGLANTFEELASESLS